jgi:hemoglobin-like flavoprotein
MGGGLSLVAAIHPPPTSSSYAACCLPPSPFRSSADMNDVVILLMPTYYTPSPVASRDITLAQASWNLILGNKSIEFLTQNTSPEFHDRYQGKCLHWFTDLFYQRFFDIHPIAKTLFLSNTFEKNNEKLSRQISLIISLTLSQRKDQKKFRKLMRELAMSHCHRGVHPIEYGIMGHVLFYTLQKCLGVQYSEIVSQAWRSIYSSMLRQIVPECVRYELEQREKNEHYQKYKAEEYERRCRGMKDSFLDRLVGSSRAASREASVARETSSYMEKSLNPNRLVYHRSEDEDGEEGDEKETAEPLPGTHLQPKDWLM